MAITLNEFIDSYNNYLKKNPGVPKTLIGTYKTRYGTYELYRSQRITTNKNTRMFIASNLYPEEDPQIFGSYAKSQIHIEINIVPPSEDILVANVYIMLPTDLVEYDSLVADSLIGQGFKLDRSHDSGKNRTPYSKRFKNVKDFEYYLNFIDRLSQNILKYMVLSKEKEEE